MIITLTSHLLSEKVKSNGASERAIKIIVVQNIFFSSLDAAQSHTQGLVVHFSFTLMWTTRRLD